MAVTTRQELIDYSLRQLGAPVLQINVDSDQVDDCVNGAIQLYQEYHADATYRAYYKYQMTDSDVTNTYITIPDEITFVNAMFPMSSGFGGGGMFDIKYQMMLNDITDLNNMAGNQGGLAYYEQMQQYLSLLDMKLNGQPQITFARKQSRVYIHGEFQNNDLQSGDWIVLEVTNVVDPNTFGSVYNDMWLKKYTTASIKRQWGQNLSKFEGMQLPGGVQFSGKEMLAEAKEELKDLKQELRDEWEMPIDMLIG